MSAPLLVLAWGRGRPHPFRVFFRSGAVDVQGHKMSVTKCHGATFSSGTLFRGKRVYLVYRSVSNVFIGSVERPLKALLVGRYS